MTVIAWDGDHIAMDTQSNMQGARATAQKYRLSECGSVLCFSGGYAEGIALSEWYVAGAKKEDYPKFQDTDEWSRLIVFRPDGTVVHYERKPVAIPVLDRYFAWGSGMDYALGAMAMGATAEIAVEVAIRHCASCGGNVITIPHKKVL